VDSVDIDGAYPCDGCGVLLSLFDGRVEAGVLLCSDLLGGEANGIRYLPEALELALLREEAGLARSACGCSLSEGVCRPSKVQGNSLISGESCSEREGSNITSSEDVGGWCTLATMVEIAKSYCCTAKFGPRVNKVAVGP